MLKKGLILQKWVRKSATEIQKEKCPLFNEGWIRRKNNERSCRIKKTTYSYLTDDNDESEEAKSTKNVS